jgi:hypothetical protein
MLDSVEVQTLLNFLQNLRYVQVFCGYFADFVANLQFIAIRRRTCDKLDDIIISIQPCSRLYNSSTVH